jgi:signal transduction histidine kinase
VSTVASESGQPNESLLLASGALDFLSGGGEMGERMRSLDWSQTPLGRPEGWPQSLRTAVSLCLSSRSPILLWWGKDLVELYNDDYRPVLGATKHPKALGARGRAIWPEIWDIIGPMLESVMRDGVATLRTDQQLFLDRNGYLEESYFTYGYSPIRDESGGIGGVFSTVFETTERVLGERRLRVLRDLAARSTGVETVSEACERLIGVLRHNPQDVPFAALYVLDRDRRCLCLEAETGDLPHALRPDELDLASTTSPWPLLEVVTGGTAQHVDLQNDEPAVRCRAWPDRVRHALVLPVQGQGSSAGVGVLICGVSPRRALDDSYRGFFDLAAGQFAAAIGDAQAYEAERERARALAEIDRAKTAFFSNVSHEFRTPLTLMLGPLEEALNNELIPEPVREALTLAQRNAHRLSKLVNSLLDFSRIEAGRAQAVYEPTDLVGLTRDIASTFGSALHRAGLTFSVECTPLEEPVYVDREMWEKIVLNLLSNALKFTLEGSVHLRLRSAGRHAVLEVADTGVGIPAVEMPRLFERFHRIENSRARTQEGSGIGLALVHELVTLHGGSIDVASDVGQGTTFYVHVPFGSSHLPGDHVRAARTLTSTATRAEAYVDEALRWLPQEDTSRSARPRIAPLDDEVPRRVEPRLQATAGSRILLADDNADMREYVRRLLEPHYIVTAVADGDAALEHARKRRPDLVLSDVMMPKLDGFGLLRALRADSNTAAVPVILLSARAGEDATIEGLAAGADDYLVKPFSARELIARVGAALALARTRQDADEQVRKSEERFRALVTASSDVIYRMSADWKEMRHLQGREFIADTLEPSQTWLDKYIHPDDQTLVLGTIEQAIRTKTIFELEHRVRQVDGSLGWTFSRALPILDERDEIVEWFGMASDITPQKELEQSLREADRQKDEFLAMLAHELRNPLAPIRTASELLARISKEPQALSVVDIVRRQVAHLSRLVDDLLDVSRITQQRIVLQKQTIEAAELIRQAVETVEPHIRERRHHLQVHSTYPALYVHGDVARLVQSLVNLLTNASKYTEPGGKIQISSRAEGPYALIEVSDNGMGIPPTLLPKIFDLFVQSDRALDRAQGGLGVGLSVVRRLVEMHGGAVLARSEGAGQGSTFSVRLPLVASPVPAAGAPTRGEIPAKRILVVDDNADAANTLAMMLRLDGHQTCEAFSGKDALEQVDAWNPEVVLLDIGLPGMDGYAVALQIRARPRGEAIRLIALTGYGQPEDRARALQGGFDEHLVKPVSQEAITSALARDAESKQM